MKVTVTEIKPYQMKNILIKLNQYLKDVITQKVLAWKLCFMIIQMKLLKNFLIHRKLFTNRFRNSNER